MTNKQNRFRQIQKVLPGKHGLLKDDYLDDAGNAVISIRIPEEMSLYEPLSAEDHRKINPEIMEYIEQNQYFIPAKYPLIIRFCGRRFSEEEKRFLSAQIRKYYMWQTEDTLDDLRSNRRHFVALGIFGILVLGFYFAVSLREENPLFPELLSVVGSFAVWEAVDSYLIERTSLKRKIRDIVQCMEATIEFPDDAGD